MPRCYCPNELKIDFSSFGLNMFKFVLRNTHQVRPWERKGGCWDMVFVKQSSASICRQSLKPHVSFVLEKTRNFQDQGLPRAPQGAFKSQRVWQSDRRLWGSNTIGHSGPHDLWGHMGLYNAWSLHLLILFPSTSSRGADRCPASSESSLREELRPSSLFQLQPTSGRRGAASSSSLPRKPPRNSSSTNLWAETWCPSGELQAHNGAAKPNRTTKATLPAKTISQNYERRSKLFSPFSWTVTQLGLILIIRILRLSKTVYWFYVMFINVICDVVIFWL